MGSKKRSENLWRKLRKSQAASVRPWLCDYASRVVPLCRSYIPPFRAFQRFILSVSTLETVPWIFSTNLRHWMVWYKVFTNQLSEIPLQCLDMPHSEVLYHSTYCFILISNVQTMAWEIELGLVSGDNRWWRGSWSEQDVLKLMVCISIFRKYCKPYYCL